MREPDSFAPVVCRMLGPGAGNAHIALCPCPKQEAVVVTASARALEAFLRRTLAVVPAGTEECHLDMDGAVHQLLSDSDPGEPLRQGLPVPDGPAPDEVADLVPGAQAPCLRARTPGR